jgi:RHS repeat-associated protein
MVMLVEDDGLTFHAPAAVRVAPLSGPLRYGGVVTENETSVRPTSFRYAGGLYSSSVALHKFGQRWYDQTLDRWTQQDPIDQTGDLKQGNRYLYVRDNPVNLTDPSGRCIGYAPGEGMEIIPESDPRCENSLGHQLVGELVETGLACASGAKYGIPLAPATGGDSLVLGCVGGISFRRSTGVSVQ